MNKLALSIVAVSIFVGASPFIADEVLLDEETQFEQNMSATVISEDVKNNRTRVGVNPGPRLDFGEIETGIRVTKFLDFNSDREQLVSLEVEGNISDKINTTESQMIEGDSRLSIAFKSNEAGYFNGSTVLKTTTPNGELGEKWLNLKLQF